MNASDPLHPAAQPTAPGRDAPVPGRWTLHGLNNGVIFGATCRGVRVLPREVSYAIGHAGTWIAWRAMPVTRAALADNLRAIFPDETDAVRERRALGTLRCYARDVIDFLRALRASDDDVRSLFVVSPGCQRVFSELLARGRGIILVTGHYGNWEIGSVVVGRLLQLPLTIVAMAEASPDVNRIRREMRENLGADTIEIRQSLDTALQIRRLLGDNRVVAMLMDRHLGRDRVPVAFLGRQAWFLRTPALLGFLTGAPLLPCFIDRAGNGQLAVGLGAPIFVSRDLPREEAARRAAQQFADELGARVLRNPQYWYHFYRYWDAQRDSYDGLV